MSQRRKLAAILSADVVGYSRLMGQDDRETVDTLHAYRAAIQALVTTHQGRVVNTPGDALLAEFPSAVEAVECAREIQNEIENRNTTLPSDRRMRFRIGVNLGDVIEEADGALYGDGVNVAARLEALAEPGGVCVSGKVFEEVEGRVRFAFVSAGEQTVKNIAKPVRVYRLQPTDAKGYVGRPKKQWSRRWVGLLTIVALALLGGGAAWWHASRAPGSSFESSQAAPGGLTVAVLPFANMSGDPKQEFFADGITEQIITELARYRDLSVIARNSTFAYKGKSVDVRQVSKELGARYVLEGSVQRRGSLMRVTAQLLDGRSGAHLWAETYERDLDQAKGFGVEDDITNHVASAIADAYGAISRTTFEAAKSKGATSLDAYECVLHYYAYQRVLTPVAHANARDCLERAVKASSEYSEAWAGLADIYSDEYVEGFNLLPDSLGRASRAAQRAVELDPANPRAHMMQAKVRFFLHDMDAFAPAANRALALNPNNADMLAWYALFWTLAHRADAEQRTRGVEAVKKAIALSPVYPSWYHFPIAWHYYAAEDYPSALAEAKKIDLPDYFWTHALLVGVYGGMGRREEARPSIVKMQELYPDYPRKVREEARKWNMPEYMIDTYIGDLRRAGFQVAE